MEARAYLLNVRPLLRNLEESSVNEFLWNFTHVNTVTWDEALKIVSGELSLLEIAFQRVNLVPLAYLKRHSPLHL